VTPIISFEVDPYLANAYQTLRVDGNEVGHVALSWSAIDVANGVRNWWPLDAHIQKAYAQGTKLSIAIEFIHGGEADLPAYRWGEFPGWDSTDLLDILTAFLGDMKGRFPRGDTVHTLAYLWLGEGPDRFAATNPGQDAEMLRFYGRLVAEARRTFPAAHIGTIVTPALIAQPQGGALVRALRDSLDILGLAVYPEDLPGGLPDPQIALERMADAIAPWQDGPFAVLEAGYPSSEALGSSLNRQSAFADLLADWLHRRPATLELFCWSPLSDPNGALADSLARRRFPLEADSSLRVDFARRIATMSLHNLDGSVKPARYDWVDRRP